MPAKDEPIQTATMAPTMYWPWPPMLKRPQRKANATARPVRISVVVSISVCWRLAAAVLRARRPVTQGKNQFRPGPVEDRLVRRQRVVAGRDGTTRPPTRKASTAVRSGVTIAARRCWANRRSARATAASRRRCGSPARAAASAGRRRVCSLTPPPPPLAAAGHRDAELLLGRARRELADDLALVDDEDAVGERQDLLQLERDEQDALPSSRSSTSRRWTNSIAPTSRPRVGCAAISTRRVAVDLAREHDLLLVAAGERRAPGVCGPPPRTSNSLSSFRARSTIRPGTASRASSRARRGSRAGRGSRRARSRARGRAAAGPRECGPRRRRTCRARRRS